MTVKDALVERLEAAEKRCSVDAYAASGGSLTRFHFLELAVLLREAITAVRGSGEQSDIIDTLRKCNADGRVSEAERFAAENPHTAALWGIEHAVTILARLAERATALPPAPKGDE